MPKRFTDTDKWKKKNFFRELPSEYKLLWLYICDDCNKSGIWDVEMDVAKMRIGIDNIDEEKALEIFNGRVISLDEGNKWFIKPFVPFQYTHLSPTHTLHKSIMDELLKYGLYNIAHEDEYPEIDFKDNANSH